MPSLLAAWASAACRSATRSMLRSAPSGKNTAPPIGTCAVALCACACAGEPYLPAGNLSAEWERRRSCALWLRADAMGACWVRAVPPDPTALEEEETVP